MSCELPCIHAPKVLASDIDWERWRSSVIRILVPIAIAALIVPWGEDVRASPIAFRVPVTVVYDASFATEFDDPISTILGRIAKVNDFLAPASIVLVLSNAQEVSASAGPLCDGPASFFSTVSTTPSAEGSVVLGLTSSHPTDDVLGCANQDSYGSSRAIAVVRDPPYVGPPLAATPALSVYHSQLLYAHELGHVLGGLHGLAWPQGIASGTTGTIMYPTLQMNAPRFSGLIEGDTCIAQGNICRIRLFVGQAEHSPSLTQSRPEPVFTLDVRP